MERMGVDEKEWEEIGRDDKRRDGNRYEGKEWKERE